MPRPPRRSRRPCCSYRSLRKNRARGLPGSRPHERRRRKPAPDIASMPAMTLVETPVDTVIPRLAAALNRRIGFRPADVMSKIAPCLALVETSDRSAYAQRLAMSPPGDLAWNKFVELMLVHETYFFGHPVQLELVCD